MTAPIFRRFGLHFLYSGRKCRLLPPSLVPVCGCHLLVVERHVEVTVEGQRLTPQHSSQGQEDGAVVQQEVKQILLSMEGTDDPI